MPHLRHARPLHDPADLFPAPSLRRGLACCGRSCGCCSCCCSCRAPEDTACAIFRRMHSETAACGASSAAALSPHLRSLADGILTRLLVPRPSRSVPGQQVRVVPGEHGARRRHRAAASAPWRQCNPPHGGHLAPHHHGRPQRQRAAGPVRPSNAATSRPVRGRLSLPSALAGRRARCRKLLEQHSFEPVPLCWWRLPLVTDSYLLFMVDILHQLKLGVERWVSLGLHAAALALCQTGAQVRQWPCPSPPACAAADIPSGHRPGEPSLRAEPRRGCRAPEDHQGAAAARPRVVVALQELQQRGAAAGWG